MSSRRSAALMLALLPAMALAQAPANDLCADAEVLTFTNGLATSSIVRNVSQAATAVETTLSCNATNARSSVWFTFTAPTTGTYGFETCGLTTFTSTIALYSGTCAALDPWPGGCATSSNTGNCTPGARFSTQTLDGGTGALTAGTTYYVQVATTSTTALPEVAQVGLRVGVESATANDSCSGTLPVLQLNRPLLVATREANTLLAANDAELDSAGSCLQAGGANQTSTTAPGEDVAVRFTPPTNGDYSFRVGQATVSSPNAVLYLTNTCVGGAPPATYLGGAGGQCLGAANRGTTGTTGAEEVSCVSLSAGTDYTLWVDASLSSTGSAYTAVATACYPESESNDQPVRANSLSCPLTANLSPALDIDFFEVGDYPGATLFALVELNASTTNDSELRVTNATDTLFYDDSDAPADMGTLSSALAGVVLPAGPTYLRVNYDTTTGVAGPYRLHTMLKFGPPTPEQEPNDTRVNANSLEGMRRFVSGDLGSTSEVDIYSFEARVGDLVFVALDGAPTRAATVGPNHNFELFDALGWSIGKADNFLTTAPVNTPSPGTLTGSTPNAPADAYAFRAATTGTHYIHVTRTSTSATALTGYTLALSTECGMVQPDLTQVALLDGGTPVQGTVLGGDTLTLTGTGFDESSQVRIAGNRADITARTQTSITVTTPQGNEGLADVSVTNFGNRTSTLPGSFTYFAPIAPPSITGVSPSFGQEADGTLVTLTGSLFKVGAEVTFTVGGTTAACTSVVVVNATELTCVTPALPAGPATITVRNPIDDLSGSLVAGYTYTPPPTFSSVSPTSGLTTGGLPEVTITGAGFLPGATVRFGTALATSVVVAGDGLSLTARPPGVTSSGPVSITVRNPDGQQIVAAAAYTYFYPAPTFATVNPAAGFAAGGQLITITGTAYLTAPPPTVSFNGTLAPSVERVSATELTVLTPPGTPGLADLLITNRDGQSIAAPQAFTFVPGPTVLSVSPSRGPVQGGTLLTITGQDFVSGARVTLGGVPAFAPTVVNSTTISVVTNSGVVGPADLVVENPDTQTSTLAAAFTFDAAPAIAALDPATGTIAGGTVVTLTGSGFRAGTTVQFGTLAATAVTVVSPTEMTATTPASPLGVVSVRVANADGQSMTVPRAFRFVAPPTLTAVSPATGDVAGAAVVTLTGTNFSALSTVSFGGVAAQRVSFVNPSSIQAVTPSHMPGAVDVVLTNPNGDTATLTAAYLYTRAAPTLTALAPASGLTTGGVQVNVTGSGFAPSTQVTFGGVEATGVVMASPELLRVIAPAHAAGAVDVAVTNDDGQVASLANGFLYVEAPVGGENVVADGGDGALVGETVDAGTGVGPGGGGCGCASVDAGLVIALGALLMRRKRRQQ